MVLRKKSNGIEIANGIDEQMPVERSRHASAKGLEAMSTLTGKALHRAKDARPMVTNFVDISAKCMPESVPGGPQIFQFRVVVEDSRGKRPEELA